MSGLSRFLLKCVVAGLLLGGPPVRSSGPMSCLSPLTICDLSSVPMA